jgi:hypothetical protein
MIEYLSLIPEEYFLPYFLISLLLEVVTCAPAKVKDILKTKPLIKTSSKRLIRK